CRDRLGRAALAGRARQCGQTQGCRGGHRDVRQSSQRAQQCCRHAREPHGDGMKAYEMRETTGLDGLVLNSSRADQQPAPGQILVRMRAAALNYRDQGVIKGAYGYTKFPLIPLSDGAGEVVATGGGGTQFKPGARGTSTFFVNWNRQRVPADASRNSLGGMVDGVLAEYALLHETGAIRIPGNLSF